MQLEAIKASAWIYRYKESQDRFLDDELAVKGKRGQKITKIVEANHIPVKTADYIGDIP